MVTPVREAVSEVRGQPLGAQGRHSLDDDTLVVVSMTW
jgi:hypothetical protein